MGTLKKWFWKMWYTYWLDYPEEPLVYVCSHNGVTGVVRADDFDNEVRRMRKFFRQKRGFHRPVRRWPYSPIRPQVYPISLFSDMTPTKRNLLTGTLGDLRKMLEECVAEERSFYVPPLSAPGWPPNSYLGRVGDAAPNAQYRKWTSRQAKEYLCIV